DYDAPPGLVPMDPRMMDLALSNLVVNACRYAVNQVRIVFSSDEAGYALAVDDDGPGIPKAQREAVFKAFARLDDSRNRDTGGYGLGLAIVARIAALRGGPARAGPSAPGGARRVVAWPRRKASEDMDSGRPRWTGTGGAMGLSCPSADAADPSQNWKRRPADPLRTEVSARSGLSAASLLRRS